MLTTQVAAYTRKREKLSLTILLVIACTLTAVVFNRNGSDNEDGYRIQMGTKPSKLVRQESTTMNSFDTAEDTTLTNSEKRALALKFAPFLYFDNDMQQYPMDAQKYLDASLYRNAAIPPISDSRKEVWNSNVGDTVTYYKVLTCGGSSQVRINYWWFYGYQPPCVTGGWGNLLSHEIHKLCRVKENCGYHKGDWEHVMVTLSVDRTQMASVTYWAHGDYGTRVAHDIPVAYNGRAIVYVGKLQHGSYSDSEQRGHLEYEGVVIPMPPGFSQACSYFADWRNSDGARHRFDVGASASNLIELDASHPPTGQSWMSNPKFCDGLPSANPVGPCGISSKPHIDTDDYCAVKMCKGEGCQVASCLSFESRSSSSECTSWIDGTKTPVTQAIPQTDYGLLPTVPPDGMLFKCNGRSEMYYQMWGEKHHIVDPQVSLGAIWGKTATQVTATLKASYCDHIPTGPAIGRDGKVIQCGSHKYFQMSANFKSWVCDQESLTKYQFGGSVHTTSHVDCRKSCNKKWLCVDPSKYESQRVTIDKTDSCKSYIVWVSTKVIDTDRGSGADDDLVIWGVNNPPAGCAPLATVATQGANGGNVPCLFGAEDDDYAKPIKYTQVWNDWGSGKHNDYSLWEPVCPHGFVPLAGASLLDVYGGNHYPTLEFQGVYCVARKHTAQSSIAHTIWSDRGTGASQDGSVWKIHGGYWMPSPNHGQPVIPPYKLVLPCVVEPGYNIVFNDFANGQKNDVGACEAWCSNDVQCVGFVFDETTSRCYLKSGFTHGFERRANTVIAGVCPKMRSCSDSGRWNGYNLRDHDLHTAVTLPAFSFKQCKFLCMMRSDCKVFTWNQVTNRCYPKSGNGGLEVSSPDVSGTCR